MRRSAGLARAFQRDAFWELLNGVVVRFDVFAASSDLNAQGRKIGGSHGTSRALVPRLAFGYGRVGSVLATFPRRERELTRVIRGRPVSAGWNLASMRFCLSGLDELVEQTMVRWDRHRGFEKVADRL